MNLHDFEKHIERKILDRGFSYYEYDHIRVLEKVDEGEFSAVVSGTEAYSVFIRLNSKLDIVEHTCDCPYDWGEYCKHEVAVLHYIRDSKIYKDSTDLMQPYNQMRLTLASYDKEGLKAFILNLAKKDIIFRKKVLDGLNIRHDYDFDPDGYYR